MSVSASRSASSTRYKANVSGVKDALTDVITKLRNIIEKGEKEIDAINTRLAAAKAKSPSVKRSVSYEEGDEVRHLQEMKAIIVARNTTYNEIIRKITAGSSGGGGSSQTRKKVKVVRTSNGDTFSIENPRKRWTGTEKYKKWVGKLTRKHKENKKEEDLCVGKGSICKGDLGIPRKLMPQFNSPEELQRFAKFVKKAYGIRSNKTRRTARDLKPSQGEINRKRIKGLIADGVLEKLNIPLVVSGDNFVVDGHHRWAAFRLKKPDAKIPVMVVDAPIKDVLGIAVAWGAKHQEF
jgi:hypothetical protein